MHPDVVVGMQEDILEDRLGDDLAGFLLVLPGVQFWSTNVHVERPDGRWRLTYTDSVETITVEHEDRTAAFLRLLARVARVDEEMGHG